jgi:hypothetical protein
MVVENVHREALSTGEPSGIASDATFDVVAEPLPAGSDTVSDPGCWAPGPALSRGSTISVALDATMLG